MANGTGTVTRRRRVTTRDPETAALVRQAAAGDRAAWNALVDRFSGLVWAVTRSTGLRDSDAADVCQTTWLRLVEHLGRIEQPERIGAWLATTARRECLRVRMRATRDVLTGDDHALEARDAPTPALDGRLVTGERDEQLRTAFSKLPPKSRSLLVLLNADPPISYAEISCILGMPIGSIGPTRARALARLRRHVEHLGISRADTRSSV